MRRTALPIAACLALLVGCNDASKSEGEGSDKSADKTADGSPAKKELSDKCNATKLTALVGAIDAAEPGARGTIVAEKFGDACEVPESVPAFFSLFAEDDGSGSLMANAGTKIHAAVGTICNGYTIIRQQLPEVEGKERGGVLYDRCDFKRFGLIDRKAWVKGQFATGLPLYAYQWLIDQGASEGQAKSIAMAMLSYEERKYTIRGQTLAKVVGSLDSVPDSPAVYVAKDRIEFNNQKVVVIDDEGKIDASVLQGHLIGPLFDQLAEEADKAKTMAATTGEDDWGGEVVIVADVDTSFGTLVDVMYSAGRAEFSKYAFVVEGTEGAGAIGISPPKFRAAGIDPRPEPSMKVLVQQDGFALPSMKFGEPPTKIAKAGDEYDYAALTKAATEFVKENPKSTQVRVSAETDIAFGVVAQTLLAVRGKDCNGDKDCVLPDLVIEAGMSADSFDPDMMARNAGILGMMAQESGHFLASPYGGAFAVGNDSEDVWGGLTGTEVGEAFGVGGLGLVGSGEGGGTGEGTIGLGNTGLIGSGGGGGSGSGYGRGSGAGFGGRGKKVPRVRQAKADVKGPLDKDIIRRIVRAHINEVRYCYNQGLARDPDMAGRVAVQFTITDAGKVSDSDVADTTLDDEDVEKCIAKAVKRWKFPKPASGGTVVVKYPFVLEPG